ncbi:MAG: hypothetical protein ACJ74Q_15315 [Pyrinomonadaceae bacterium]
MRLKALEKYSSGWLIALYAAGLFAVGLAAGPVSKVLGVKEFPGLVWCVAGLHFLYGCLLLRRMGKRAFLGFAESGAASLCYLVLLLAVRVYLLPSLGSINLFELALCFMFAGVGFGECVWAGFSVLAGIYAMGVESVCASIAREAERGGGRER